MRHEMMSRTMNPSFFLNFSRATSREEARPSRFRSLVSFLVSGFVILIFHDFPIPEFERGFIVIRSRLAIDQRNQANPRLLEDRVTRVSRSREVNVRFSRRNLVQRHVTARATLSPTSPRLDVPLRNRAAGYKTIRKNN
jgi:hypothetical protein